MQHKQAQIRWISFSIDKTLAVVEVYVLYTLIYPDFRDQILEGVGRLIAWGIFAPISLRNFPELRQYFKWRVSESEATAKRTQQ